jgi:hypothetical protein
MDEPSWLVSFQTRWDTLRAIRESGTKGDFEQESLGAPTLMGWPFYAEAV